MDVRDASPNASGHRLPKFLEARLSLVVIQAHSVIQAQQLRFNSVQDIPRKLRKKIGPGRRRFEAGKEEAQKKASRSSVCRSVAERIYLRIISSKIKIMESRFLGMN